MAGGGGSGGGGGGDGVLDPVWDDMNRTLGQLFMASRSYRLPSPFGPHAYGNVDGL